MSIKGTLNGQDEVLLEHGMSISIHQMQLDGQGYPISPTVTCLSQNNKRWETTIDGLGCDPTSEATRYECVDFRLVPWLGRFLVFAGGQKVSIIDRMNGRQVDSGDLVFTGKESLDVLLVSENPEQKILIVVSTRMLVGIGATGRILWTMDPKGLVVELNDLRGFELGIKLRDLNDVELGLVEVCFDIRNGNRLES